MDDDVLTGPSPFWTAFFILFFISEGGMFPSDHSLIFPMLFKGSKSWAFPVADREAVFPAIIPKVTMLERAFPPIRLAPSIPPVTSPHAKSPLMLVEHEGSISIPPVM